MMFSLIKNEWIKLFSKKSTFVIIILMMLLSIAAPYITYKSDSLINNNESYRNNLLNERKYLEQNISGTADGQKDGSVYYQKAYNNGSLEVIDLKLNANINGYDDWREGQSYQLNTLYLERNLIDYYLTKNKDAIKEIENSGHVSEIDQEAIKDYITNNSTQKLSARYERLTADIDNYRNAIINNDATFINRLNVDISNTNIKNIENSIAEYKKNLHYADSSAKDDINKQIAQLEISLKKEKELLIWSNYRLNNNISLDVKDWRNQSVEAITGAIQKAYAEPMTKEFYDKTGGNSEYGQNLTYEEYLNKLNEDIAKSKDNIILYTYSLDNNIPPMEFANSTRQNINQIYFILTLVSMAMIFLISPMISNEYSKGTIRLLLIRPVRRTKILLSKLLAALEIAVLLLAICGFVYVATTILLFGAADFQYPILSVKNGVLLSTTILAKVIPILFKSAIAVLFVMSLSFAFSAIVKSTVLAVGLPFALMSFSTILFLLLVQLKYYAIAAYSIFPYMNMANVITKTGTIGMLMNSTPQLNLSVNYGMLLLAGLSILLLGISFWVFNKRDVKS